MNKLLIAIIVILIVVGVAYFIYKKYEPEEEKISYNISISTQFEHELIKTGIEINGETYNTSKSYEIFKLSEGINVIKNINLEDQSYYQNEIEVNITKKERIDIKLEKPQFPEIEIRSGNPIELRIKSLDFRDVDFCLKSSLAYLFVEPEENEFEYVNLTKDEEQIIIRKSEYLKNTIYYEEYKLKYFEKIEDFKRINKEDFENFGDCYDGDFTLGEKTLEISFVEFISPSNEDFIEITLIDREGNYLSKIIK